MDDTVMSDEPVTDVREHVAAVDCWCGPVEDEPGVWVHQVLH
jgi:hypothetical protein